MVMKNILLLYESQKNGGQSFNLYNTGMKLAAALIALLLAAPAPRSAAGELSVDEFMERLPDLMESAPEPPEISETEILELEEEDPKTYIFINRAKARPPRPEFLGGDGRLTLFRRGGGSVSAVYRRKDGSYDRAGAEKIDRIMRCSVTGRQTDISLKLIEVLDAVEDRFGGKGLVLLSGYRSPVHNRHTPGSARWSLHMLGWAADIRIPGVKTRDIAAFAAKLRAGGVGHYPDAGFVHLDSGKRRSWRTARRKKPAAKN